MAPWFVPLAIGGRLAGFAQLRRDLELMRYSSFRRQGEAGPDLRAWIDADTIRKRAATLKRPDEVLGQPVLTYDRDPARLVWAVTATSPDGSARRIHVLGEHVSEARPAPDAPEFGRGPATG